jgi:amino acid transporter
MGEFFGFLQGWWCTLAVYVDSSVYVVLAVGYIATFLSLTPLTTWLLAVVIISVFAYINIRGIHLVGTTSVIFSIIVLLPFIALSAMGLFQMHHSPFIPFVPQGETVGSSIGLGLAIAMWMYAGYAAIGSVAGEIENSHKLIPKAMVLVLIAMIVAYVVPTIIGVGAVGQWGKWAVSGGISFVQAGKVIGGSVLGIAMLAAAISSNFALFSDFLATGTRIPYIMSEDNLLPKFYQKLHKKYQTPYISILIMAFIDMLLCIGTFDGIIVIDVFLIMFYTIMILLAVIILRVKEPDLPRPFKMPGGTLAISIMIAPAIIIAIIALFTNGTSYIIGGLIGIASGPIAYVIFKKIYGGVAKNPFDPKSIPPEKFAVPE